MSIQLYTIRLKRFYVFLIGFAPLWIVIPVLFQELIGNQIVAIIIGLFLLTATAVTAQFLARKETTLAIVNNTVSFDEMSMDIEDIHHIKIDKSGVGTSSIEFHLKTGGKSVMTLTNLKNNANKAIAFVEKNLPEIEQKKPVDLLD